MNIKTIVIATIAIYTVNSRATEAIKIYDAEKMTSIENYWTQEKIKQVIPLPHPKLNEKELRKLIGKKSEVGSSKRPIQSINESDVDIQITPGVPERADINQSPFSKGGVLLFTKPDTQQYLCSAQFVGDNILLTAAHCVRNGKTGEWYDNFVFYRAYNNGRGEKFIAQCVVANDKWSNPKTNYQYDYAFIKTKTNTNNGWLSLKMKVPYQNWMAIGYPKNYDENKYMYKVFGSKGIHKSGIIEMRNNPMRHGNSGGAWIVEEPFSLNSIQYAIGLNSFHSDNYPNSEFGPVFDNELMALYDKAVNN